MFLKFLTDLDSISFLFGFATATVLGWLLRRIAPTFSTAVKKSREKRLARKSSVRLTVEYDYRNDFIRFAQGLHLGAPLFSLEEVLVPPYLLAPPSQTTPAGDNFSTNTLSKILPYMPDLPEFASTFGAEKLTLAEALRNGANLALMGPAGSGKTVALAHFGTLVASFSGEAGAFANHIPFYVHAAELQLPLPEEEDPFNAIFYTLNESSYLSRKTAAKLSNLVQAALSEERAFLLLDGLDEIAPREIDLVREFLRTLMLEYPALRIVAAVSSDFFDGITRLGLHPVTMAGWTTAERKGFIRTWSRRWTELIDNGIWQNSTSGIENHMLVNWLEQETHLLTPLELTLRAWAVFAGDAIGPRNQHSIEAFARRFTASIAGADTALERVGMQMALAQRPVIHHRAATLWSRGQMVDVDSPDVLSEQVPTSSEDDTSPSRVGRGTIQALVAAGFLADRGKERIGFLHPVIAGYFAGRGLANFGRAGVLVSQQAWALRESALHYLAGQTDITPLLKALETADPVEAEIMAAGRWLRDIDPKSGGRTLLMRKLVSLFQDDNRPAMLRMRAMTALALSADPGIGALSKKLMDSTDLLTRTMCVLAMGYQRNEKHIQDISKAISDPAFVVRAAACFALANFGNKQALETVATALLHGDEDTQRAAAEALSIDPSEGFAYLTEASGEEDLLVRRSAIFGLGKTRRPEAWDLIRRLELEDGQWVVRNAATQEVLRKEKGSPATPVPFEPLHQTGWLVAFAGESGENVAPGRAAADLLFRALVKGNPEQRLAAMDQYRLSGSETVWTALYEILKQPHGAEIHNAAINTLWHLRGQGFGFQPAEAARIS